MGVRIKRTPPAGRKRGCWLKFTVAAGFLASVLVTTAVGFVLVACERQDPPPTHQRQLAPAVLTFNPDTVLDPAQVQDIQDEDWRDYSSSFPTTPAFPGR